MARLGVVGVGNIGGAVAANLVADGHDVTVVDADRRRAAGVTGATVSPSVSDLAAATEITITSLPTSAAVRSVADEWVGAAAPGGILLDLSTGAPADSRDLAARLARTGHHLVEAPLTGGATGARQRSLVFMVGGDDEPVTRCLPLLDRLGRATFHLGPVGAGSTMKLVNSLVAYACTWASLEALSLAAAEGVDLRDAVEVVRTAGASNFFIDRAVEGINTRGRPAQFALGLAAKDAALIRDLAGRDGVPAPVADAIASVLGDAVERGMGERDWSDLVELAEAQSGRDLRLRPPPAG